MNNQKKLNLFSKMDLLAQFRHKSGAFICIGQSIGIEFTGLH